MKHEERGAERGAVGNRDPSRTRRGSRSPRTATASVEAIDCLSGASPEAGKRGADEIRHIAGANSGPVEMFHVKHHLRPDVGRHTETFSVVRPTTRYRRCRPNGPRSGTAQLLGPTASYTSPKQCEYGHEKLPARRGSGSPIATPRAHVTSDPTRDRLPVDSIRRSIRHRNPAVDNDQAGATREGFTSSLPAVVHDKRS